MSIKSQIENAIARVFKSGKAEEFIDAAAEKTIKETIDKAFRTYGTIGKQIEKALEEDLKLSIRHFDLAGYNASIAGMAEKLMNEYLQEEAGKAIADRLEEYLKPAPKEITVQEIVDYFINEWKETGDFSINPVIDIQASSWSEESTSIKLWQDGRYTTTITKRENTPDMDIYIYKNQITIPRLSTNVFSSRIAFQLDSFIYTMAIRGTKILDAHTIDSGDINVSLYDD